MTTASAPAPASQSLFRDALSQNAAGHASGNSPINVVPRDLIKTGLYQSGSSPLVTQREKPTDAVPRPAAVTAHKKSRKRKSEKSKRERELWTPQEDAALKELVKKHGPKKWSHIAKLLNVNNMNRNKKQCRERWANHLKEGIVKSRRTPEEDKVIIEKQAELGNRWAQINFSQRPYRQCCKKSLERIIEKSNQEKQAKAAEGSKASRKRDRKRSSASEKTGETRFGAQALEMIRRLEGLHQDPLLVSSSVRPPAIRVESRRKRKEHRAVRATLQQREKIRRRRRRVEVKGRARRSRRSWQWLQRL